MTPRRLEPDVKKAIRLTVLFTEAEMARLERVCAFYALAKSVAAHDMIIKAMADMDLPEIDANALAEGEAKQDDWRERLGLT